MAKWKRSKTTLSPGDIPDGGAHWTVERVYEERFTVFGTGEPENRRMIKFREHELPLKVAKSCEDAFVNAWGDDTDAALGGKVHLTVKSWVKDDGDTASMILSAPETPPAPEEAQRIKLALQKEEEDLLADALRF